MAPATAGSSTVIAGPLYGALVSIVNALPGERRQRGPHVTRRDVVDEFEGSDGRRPDDGTASIARLLVPSHGGQHSVGIDIIGAGGESDLREHPLLTLDGRRIGDVQPPSQPSLRDDAERDCLAVRPALVTAGRLQRMTDGVSVVQHGAQVRLLLVPLDDPGLEPARASA